MSSQTPPGVDVGRELGHALSDLCAALRGDGPRTGEAGGVGGILAGHALVGPVVGCAVCLIEGDAVRVVGTAGSSGTVTGGSVWDLAASPVAQSLAGTSQLSVVSESSSALGRALCAGGSGRLLAAPLRVGERGDGEPTSLGALLLLRDRGGPIDDELCDFFADYASLVTLAMLDALPAQDWAGRARRLRGSVDVAVDLVGSLDEGQVIPRVLQRACEALEASRATLVRLDGDEVVVEGVHDVDGRPAVPGWRGPLSDGGALLEAARSRDVVIGDGVGGEHLPAELRSALTDVRHTMVLPLSTGERVTGFMVVCRRQPRPFIRDDAVTLELLGHVAVLALRNSRLYSDAQAASAAMASFLNLIVHDLRAPLTVLSGYVDLLRDGTFGEGPDTWQKPLEMITAKLQETHRLVDDLLLSARLDNGALPVAVETIDLNQVIERAAARSEPRAGLAQARVETIPHQTPVAVMADPFKVDRIVDNLINNAISYGGDSPWVRLSVEASQPPAIRVEDHGVGISPELHSRIFDRFFRIDHRIPGTGFGLHVGRVLAEACGGSLRVERSVPGKGSVFRLELPPVTASG